MEKIDEIIELIDTKENKESRNFFLKYLSNWYWFVICVIVGVGLGYFIYKNLPENYLVSSKLLVKDENATVSPNLNFSNQQQPQRILEPMNIIKSR